MAVFLYLSLFYHALAAFLLPPELQGKLIEYCINLQSIYRLSVASKSFYAAISTRIDEPTMCSLLHVKSIDEAIQRFQLIHEKFARPGSGGILAAAYIRVVCIALSRLLPDNSALPRTDNICLSPPTGHIKISLVAYFQSKHSNIHADFAWFCGQLVDFRYFEAMLSCMGERPYFASVIVSITEPSATDSLFLYCVQTRKMDKLKLEVFTFINTDDLLAIKGIYKGIDASTHKKAMNAAFKCYPVHICKSLCVSPLPMNEEQRKQFLDDGVVKFIAGCDSKMVLSILLEYCNGQHIMANREYLISSIKSKLLED